MRPFLRLTALLAAATALPAALAARPSAPQDAAPNEEVTADENAGKETAATNEALERRIRELTEEIERLSAEAPAGRAEAEAAAAGQQTDVAELERRVDLVAEELERLRSGEQEQRIPIEEARALGLAPSAAATYGADSGVSIAGYGEMLYENYASDKTTQFDFLRAILYAGYRFNDKFLFNSEIEVEHAKEIFVEFAYVDYQATENFGLRAGMLLMPMGLVNEFHEPTVFIGAERPVTEQRIIPTTWRENGGGAYYAGDLVSARLYVVNGLNGSAFSSSGVRGGRQKGAKAKANDMAFTGRLDFTPTPGFFAGASFYAGGSGQGEIEVDGTAYGVQTTIFDVHAQAQFRGLDLRALYARATLSDVAQLNEALGFSDDGGVGETLQGAYVQAGYDILSQISGTGSVALTPYVRYEVVDTQAAVPAGFTRSPSKNNTFTTAGLELRPIPSVVLKVDHMWVNNDADSGVNQWNVSVGYAF